MNLQNKIYLISAIFGLIILVLIVFFVSPLFKEIKKNSQDLIAFKKELISLEAKIENLRKFKEIFKTLEPDSEKIDKLLVDSEVPIDFIKFLEKTASDSQVLIEISSTSFKIVQTDPWPSLGFQIILTGSFPNYLKFLEKLETSPYLTEIQNLIVRRLSENEIRLMAKTLSLGDVKATLSIKVFTK